MISNNINSGASVYDELGISAKSKAVETSNENDLAQEDFLTLMTTQLKNQDPFAPMESGEFLGQMAQFGTVKGLDDLNSSFSGLAESLYSNQAFMASSMVGKGALIAGNSSYLSEGGSVNGSVEIPHSVGDLRISVYDAAGQVVRQMDIGVQQEGMTDFSWDGTDGDGNAMPAGQYRIAAEATVNGAYSGLSTMMEGRIRSVTLSSGGSGLKFSVDGMGDVSFSDIKQIRS